MRRRRSPPVQDRPTHLSPMGTLPIYDEDIAIDDGLAAGLDPVACSDDNPFTINWQLARAWHLAFVEGRRVVDAANTPFFLPRPRPSSGQMHV